MSLEEVVRARNPDGGILPFLDDCIACLEQKWLETQGLFRISANKPKLDVIRATIDKGIASLVSSFLMCKVEW